jgi:hypothetical protein
MALIHTPDEPVFATLATDFDLPAVEATTEIAAGRPVRAPQQASMGCSIKWRD